VITIRLLTPDELDTAEEIGQSAFGLSATIGDTFHIAHDSQPDGCFMAFADGEPVGTATIVDYGPFSYIGAMCVREELQRRGIGKALLDRVLEWKEEKGIPIARLDASGAGAPLYRQLGFREIDQVLRYRCGVIPRWDECIHRSNGPGRKPCGPVQVSAVRPLKEGDLGSLLELDRRIFGGNREAVFRALLHSFPDRAFVYFNEEEEIEGFVFCQGARIGPWVAQDAGVAEILLNRALGLPYRHLPSLCVPAVNSDARELLEAYRFEATPHIHMGLGTTEPAGKREMVYGQTSFALG
jgi:ribosomal-protein-alanine N-acetyltransferase